MAEEPVHRKSFRLDADVATLLQQRKHKGSYGTTENEVVNQLLRNIPRQEAEILRQVQLVDQERQQKQHWVTRAEQAEQELHALKSALHLLGSLLHKPT